MEQNKTLVADFWSKIDCSASEKNFYCFPAIKTHSCQLIFDENDASRRDWCEYWTVEKYLKDKIPFGKCLSICCGFGKVERLLSSMNVAEKFIGCDIAPGAIEKARQQAAEDGFDNIEYYVSDLNDGILKEQEFDLIWANGALHHIENLDYVIPMLYRALKPGGYLVSNEYVGPRYQQIPPRQQEIVNAVKHMLLPEFRREAEKRDIYGNVLKMKPVEHFLRTDPSECINSNNIIPTLQKHFDEVEVKYFNGSILFYALGAEFYDNFNFNNPRHKRFLEMLFNIEDTLIEIGEIGQDNAHIICRKKEPAPSIVADDIQAHAGSYNSQYNNSPVCDPSILLYHRVANDPIDSQLLTVSPNNFEAHLKELAENYRVVPLHQLLVEARTGQITPNTTAITFDEGYLDNLTNALPLLEKYGLHATIFVTSGMVGSQKEFWWDALERLFLATPNIPQSLNVSYAGGHFDLNLATPQDRLKALDELAGFLRLQPVEEIEPFVDKLFGWAQISRIARASHRVITPEQLRQLAASPSVEIGSHTVTHTRLSSLSPDAQLREISHSKQYLESVTAKPVRILSYPFGSEGDFTAETARITTEEGFEAGIANIQGAVTLPIDMYSVPRRLVRNWTQEQFTTWLRNSDKSTLEAQTLDERVEKVTANSAK